MAKIIFALDYDNLDEAMEKVRILKPEIEYFKIGLQLFTLYGPEAVRRVQAEGGRVFLDLKLHDIPQTCMLATKAAAELGCFSMTIHISAGREALIGSRKAQIEGFPNLWGVTVLSSMPETEDSLEKAAIAQESGLDGVIVSGKDVEKIKKNFPGLTVTVPGIRPADYSKKDDQKRVLTPKEAAGKGADFLVIGRPIKNSADPVGLVKSIKKEIEQ
ncbi:MAG: orotidine-5'-phosphate decarboxylase [Elusimicrobia bacterium]|nr:orotidine-5'-phosphate decarboxylase [Elusimicrobiota bacterium]